MKKTAIISALIMTSASLFAQEKMTVKGNVASQLWAPVAGASVTIKGTDQGVLTDVHGNYEIQAAKGQTLVFSLAGHKTTEVVVNGATVDATLNVTFKSVTVNPDNTITFVYSAPKAQSVQVGGNFFQLANGTQFYWSPRYQAYVCWVPATMTSADLNGFVKFTNENKTVTIVNGGDINFDGAVDSADAGIVNDAIHGTRLVPTSALQLFEMDVANTGDKSLVAGATIDANDVTWILQKTVGKTVATAYNPLLAQAQ